MDLQFGASDHDLAITDDEHSEHAVSLDLKEHQIGFIVPANSLLRGEFLLSTGALILGSVCGRLVCSQGSIIVHRGATFEGEMEADQVFVDGEVRNISGSTAQLLAHTARTTPAAAAGALAGLAGTFKQKIAEGSMSRIVGRQCVAISNMAAGKADIASTNFAAHGRSFAARYLPLQAAPAAS
jgi:hypothetical protein